MPTVIKATDRNAGIHGVAYNFTDMAVEADRRLGKFNDEAVAIVERAKQEAQQIKQQAQAAGRQAAPLRSLSMNSGRKTMNFRSGSGR